MITIKKTILFTLLLFLLSPIASQAMFRYKGMYTSKQEKETHDAQFVDKQIWPIKLKENSVAVKRFLCRHNMNPHCRIDNPSLILLSEALLRHGGHGIGSLDELLNEHDPSFIMQALKLSARFKTEMWDHAYNKRIKVEEHILNKHWNSLYYVLVQQRPIKAYKPYYQHGISALPMREKRALETLPHTLDCAKQREARENARNHEEYDRRMAYGQELRERAYADACTANILHEQRENERSLITVIPVPALVPDIFLPAQDASPEPEEPQIPNEHGAIVDQEQEEKEEDCIIKKEWVIVG